MKHQIWLIRIWDYKRMIIAINKPIGPTSFDIVAKVRKITNTKKVGHAGTLDPLASGVLVVAVGREDTKKISSIVEKEKEYVAEVTLGEESSTDDNEGEKLLINGSVPELGDIKAVLLHFIGEIYQVPPIFSAMKINGKRAYKLAREGKEVEMKSRKVEIKEIELLEYTYPILKIRVVTGPGVYIRSLARDIGRELGTGAYMSGLIRTRVGEFTIDKAKTIEEFEKKYSNNVIPTGAM
ncbi:MAG: tRNA pseudouridine(55) synthase TruB [Candidatus Buchananbacteria bacterium]